MAEVSAGKDSVTGHWEMMGVVLDRAFPTFPAGFPPELIAEFERRIGRGTLGNVVASGTEIIDRLGAEHMRTGKPIVYTSADSVFQIAAHEDVIPIAEQYRICEVASSWRRAGRASAASSPGLSSAAGRIHAHRQSPRLRARTDGRHAARRLVARRHRRRCRSARSRDLFAGRGISRAVPTSSDADGMAKLAAAMSDTPGGLIFVNLVDFDAVYGHRNDVAGYAANLERFDEALARLLPSLRERGSAGHHRRSRQRSHARRAPITRASMCRCSLTGARVRRGIDLGTRATFADLGQTIADNFGVGPLAHGTSFLEDIVAGRRVQHS